MFKRMRFAGAWGVEKPIEVLPAMAELFEATRNRFRFIVDRSFQSLQWRFESAPSHYHYFVAKRDGRLVGYLVGRLVLDEENSSAFIADYLAAEGEEASLAALSIHFALLALDKGCEKLEVWC
ncbi:MAG: hypothetical protein V4760_05230, partial [Bdellovibrionota bacterium]